MIPRNRISIHPGELLREEYLPEYSLSQTQLAEKLGVSFKTVNEIINEKRNLTPVVALKLAHLFGTSDEFWMNIQKTYELSKAYLKEKEAIEKVQKLALH
jgi:addiction module HigA family antidote